MQSVQFSALSLKKIKKIPSPQCLKMRPKKYIQ